MMKKTAAVPKGLSRPPLARMQKIHKALKCGEYPNCTRLGVELEVSYKTIQRDITFMQERFRLPIEFDRVRNGF
jgi:proteasome accessory factor B